MVISLILDNVNAQRNTCLSLKRVPQISLLEYIMRISKYLNLEESTYILAIIYLDKFLTKVPLTENNIHKLLLTSFLIAAKMNEDIIIHNIYFAKVGGVQLATITQMESEFLEILDFQIYVGLEEFEVYENFIFENQQ